MMDSTYPTYSSQDYLIQTHGSSRWAAPNVNMSPLRPIGFDELTLHGENPDLADESTTKVCRWNSPYSAHATPSPGRNQAALREYDHCSRSGTYLNNQPQPALSTCDICSSSLNHLTPPYVVYGMTESTNFPIDMAQWSPNGHSTNQSFSSPFTPMFFQPDHATMRGMSLPGIAVHPMEPHVPYLTYTPNTACAKRGENQSHNDEALSIDKEDAVTKIGSVLSNGMFVCDAEECGSRTFSRRAELDRHYTSRHVANKPNYWCQVPGCPRSLGGGGEAFHRKDKRASHEQNMHSDVLKLFR